MAYAQELDELAAWGRDRGGEFRLLVLIARMLLTLVLNMESK